jgi:maleamate amidohydrolase
MAIDPNISQLRGSYEKAGFSAPLPFGKRPALLVVDVVQAYLEPSSPLFAQDFVDAVAPNCSLIAAARAAGITVVFTCVVYSADGRDGGKFFQKVPALRSFIKGSPLGNFARGLNPQPEDVVIVKQYASAFFGTSLASTLNASGIDTVLVTGFSTSGCVRATALDALQYGFSPFVIREACADRDPRPHEANLFDLQMKYAEVVSAQWVLEKLARIAPP